MRTICIINLKGGVAKTLTAVNMAHILATVHNKRVLLIDNDKQGNTSKMFGLHSYDEKSVSELLTERSPDLEEIIAATRYKFLDLIPANMSLLDANKMTMIDNSWQRETRFKKALAPVSGDYDYCIIDNAPDINIGIVNALTMSDDIIIPIKIDQFAFDGLKELKRHIASVKEDLNPELRLMGCLVTCYSRNDVNAQGEEHLRTQMGFPVFATHIRRTEKADESTFATMPILEYSPRCGASRDYQSLVREYLEKLSDLDNNHKKK